MNALIALKQSITPKSEANLNQLFSAQTLKVIELLKANDLFQIPANSHPLHTLLCDYLQNRIEKLEDDIDLKEEAEKTITSIKKIITQLICKNLKYENLLDKYDEEPALRRLNLFFDLFKKELKNFISKNIEKNLSISELLKELRLWLDTRNNNFISSSALDKTLSRIELELEHFQNAYPLEDLSKNFKRQIYQEVLAEVIKALCLSSNHEEGICYGHTIATFSLLPNQFGAAFWQERHFLFANHKYFETRFLIGLGMQVEHFAQSLPSVLKKASYVLGCAVDEVLNQDDKYFLYHLLGRTLLSYYENSDLSTQSEINELLLASAIHECNPSPMDIAIETERHSLTVQFILNHPDDFPNIIQNKHLLDEKLSLKFLNRLPALEKALYCRVRKVYLATIFEQKDLSRLGLDYFKLEKCAPIDQLLTTIKSLHHDEASNSTQKFYFLGLYSTGAASGHSVGFTLCPQFSFFDSNDYDYLTLRPIVRTFANFDEFNEYLILYLIYKYDYELFSISSYQRSSSPELHRSLLNFHCQQLRLRKVFRKEQKEWIQAREARIETGPLSEKKKKRLAKFCIRALQRLDEDKENLKGYLEFITPFVLERISELHTKKEDASNVKSAKSYDGLIKSYQSVLDLSEYG